MKKRSRNLCRANNLLLQSFFDAFLTLHFFLIAVFPTLHVNHMYHHPIISLFSKIISPPIPHLFYKICIQFLSRFLSPPLSLSLCQTQSQVLAPLSLCSPPHSRRNFELLRTAEILIHDLRSTIRPHNSNRNQLESCDNNSNTN